ncbi:retropepsin-like domain-containing protein [Candidatus Woesearchaeota archaeon]|nr:retropepsin-like domain-containing protein [Candidatus Woesearchaeota archaeon]MBW2978807.1 retropepsin-like domain-containing protein [Candidatus Woesearchaeota archaeon]
MKQINIGFKSKVTFYGKKKNKTVMARIDTGAKRCSIDKKLAEQIGIGKISKYIIVKSASGTGKRPIVRLKIKIKGKAFYAHCTIADRSRLKYPALIGRNILCKGFLVGSQRKK